MALTPEQKQKADDYFGPIEGANGHGATQHELFPTAGMDLSYDRPNVKAVISVEIRMSGIRECVRRLSYEAKNVTPSDEIPLRNRVMMSMGNYLEPMVKELMREDGWNVRNGGAVIIPHGLIVLTGHPDGIASHDLLTGGEEAIAEVKTRAESIANYAWEFGVERTHPESVEQAALYSVAIFGGPRDVIVSTMARDSGEYRSERIPADRVAKAYEAAMKRVNEIAQMVLDGVTPEPELPRGDSHCQSCPFRTMCGNAEPEPKPGENGLTSEEVEAYLKAWAEADAIAPKSSSPAAKDKKAAADALKSHFIATETYEDEVVIDGVPYKMKLSESPKASIDMEAFNELVAPEIREQVVIETVGRTFRVTPQKKAKSGGKGKAASTAKDKTASAAKAAPTKADTEKADTATVDTPATDTSVKDKPAKGKAAAPAKGKSTASKAATEDETTPAKAASAKAAPAKDAPAKAEVDKSDKSESGGKDTGSAPVAEATQGVLA